MRTPQGDLEKDLKDPEFARLYKKESEKDEKIIQKARAKSLLAMSNLKAPFPYFGGKSKVAGLVWQALGDCSRYIEPFFGSGAVLLKRPGWKPEMDEIVCDSDGYVANVWRSIQFHPDEVARWCDWPVNHADLSARKLELIRNESNLLENLTKDPKWCDPVMAGYWVWAASCWIGAGLTRIGQIPHLTGEMGVHALGQIPHLTGEMGVHAQSSRVYAWMRQLSERLRYVKVVCGDWSRVCGGNWQSEKGVCGIFFDPPYSAEAGRDDNIYHKESSTVAQDVARWAAERAQDNRYRIVLAGYYNEHEWLLGERWSCHQWSATGGYANQSKVKNENRHKEALFLSPHCLSKRLL